MNYFSRYHDKLPLVLFHIIFAFILLANFPFGWYFIGWDAINPEFNFPLNFHRAFFAFWQENYGVGLLGGHGFAATLPHTIITYILSFFIPTSGIRPFFTFLCLYIGGIGMYVLSKMILKDIFSEKFTTQDSKRKKDLNNFSLSDPPLAESRRVYSEELSLRQAQTRTLSMYPVIVEYFALFAALFYMLNLGTVQMFYAQLETFIAHFASLPWLFWILLKIFHTFSRKNLILFFVINFFATIQGFIPSLFVAYITALIIFFTLFTIQQQSKIVSLKKSSLILALTIIINLYWLLPVAYFQLTRSGIFLNSYNNLLSTPHFIEVNTKYGDLANVALLKGYLFDSRELGDFILRPWINHHSIPLVPFIGYAFFAITIFGLMYTIIRIKNTVARSLCGVFVFFFVNLATNTPPFSYLIDVLQIISPTYQQAFRTSFTKFSLGLSFSYSVFLAIGIIVVIHYFYKFFQYKKYRVLFLGCIFLLLLLYSLPTFRGNYLYRNLMIKIPKEYFDIIEFFKDKEDGRIADFPQECAEGWYAYKWGYFGSGFYWYGIKQPFLSRTFDVWSNSNENYFWEVSQALREQQYERIDAIFQKYKVKWVLYDPNIYHCRTQRGVFLDQDFIHHLENSKNYTLLKTFSGSEGVLPIKLFKNNQDTSESFISIKKNMPLVGPEYEWSDSDTAYEDLSDYIVNAKKSDIYYPYRSLFTKRGDTKNDFIVEDARDLLVFQTKLPPSLKNHIFKFKPYTTLEDSIPATFNIQNAGGNLYQISLALLYPQVDLDGIPLTPPNTSMPVGEFRTDLGSDFRVFVNGEEIIQKNEDVQSYEAVFYFNLPNKVEVFTQNKSLLFSWNSTFADLSQTSVQPDVSVAVPSFTEGNLKVFIPKIEDKKRHGITVLPGLETIAPRSCSDSTISTNNRYEVGKKGENEYLRLISQNSNQCIQIHIAGTPTSSAYLLEIDTQWLRGNSLKLSIFNKERLVYNDVVVPRTNSNRSLFILPPSFPTEIGYDIVLQNMSESGEETVNDFLGMKMWHIPYTFLKTLRLDSGLNNDFSSVDESRDVRVRHPNETRYEIDFLKNVDDRYIVLSQGFDGGWKAYEVATSDWQLATSIKKMLPFLFGKKIGDHVVVNGWENGWLLDNKAIEQYNNKTIVMVFLPQYLEFFGFGLLGVLLIFSLTTNTKPI